MKCAIFDRFTLVCGRAPARSDLIELARSFDRLLGDRGIEHEYVEVSGGLCSFYFDPIVQFMSDHLAGEPAE